MITCGQLQRLGMRSECCTAGLFVTLNPAGKGYAGRSKLPDNLKALFRSVAMAAPDDVVIAEVLLLSQGFSAANSGAQALVALLDLSRQRLAPMKHYDWGLRSLKTILNVAGMAYPLTEIGCSNECMDLSDTRFRGIHFTQACT